jgi:hypothetical protein
MKKSKLVSICLTLILAFTLTVGAASQAMAMVPIVMAAGAMIGGIMSAMGIGAGAMGAGAMGAGAMSAGATGASSLASNAGSTLMESGNWDNMTSVNRDGSKPVNADDMGNMDPSSAHMQ